MTHKYQFGAFLLDANERQLSHDGEAIHLQPKDFDVLHYLLQHAGQLASKQDIMDAVWGEVVVSENSLNRCIGKIRTVLHDAAATPAYIETIPTHGYRLICKVQIVPTVGQPIGQPAIDKMTDATTSSQPVTAPLRNSYRNLIYITLALVVMVAGYQSANRLLIEASIPIDNMSIAVLVLRNESPDPDHEYFAVGIHEEILNQLVKISAIQVTPRTAVLRYKDSELSPVEIARELGVSWVMDGSVRFADNNVKISLQLIDTIDDVLLWSETYPRKFEEIFAIESDIAMKVANAMQAVLLPDEIASIERHVTVSTEAYDLFLQTRFQTRPGSFPVIIDDNIEKLEQAVELDPLFAVGFAELAQHKYWKGLYTQSGVRKSFFDEAFDDANQAIEIDPDIGLAYMVLGRVSLSRLEFDEWERYASQSVELPDLEGTSASNYAVGLAWRGQYEDAWRLDDLAMLRNRLNQPIQGIAVWNRIAGRDYETALIMIERSRAIGADDWNYNVMRAYALNRLGRQAESIEAFNNLPRDRMEPNRTPSGEYHAYLLCQSGDADSVMAELEQSENYRKVWKMIYCTAGTGDLDRMFASYHRAMSVGEIIPYNDLISEELRADPRWQAVLDYMGLKDPD